MGAYSDAVIASGPLAYYRLGESAGATTCVDASGNAHPATVTGGVTFGQPGAIPDGNTAALFNGTTGRAATTDNVNVTGLSALSFEAWIRNPGFTAAHEVIVSVGGQGHYLSVVDTGRLIMSIHVGSQFTNRALPATALAPNTWYHVVGTWASGQPMRLYVNGLEIAGDTPTARTGTLTNSPNICIGAFGPTSPSLFHSGVLDEVAVYPTQLSAAAVQAHYAAAMASLPGVPAWLAGEDLMAQSYNLWRTITPSDTVDLPMPTDAIFVGAAGTVAAVMGNGQAVQLTVPAGAWIPIAARRINATGTTATGLVALNGR